METPELREAYDAARLRLMRAEEAHRVAHAELEDAWSALAEARKALHAANTPRPYRITLPQMGTGRGVNDSEGRVIVEYRDV